MAKLSSQLLTPPHVMEMMIPKTCFTFSYIGLLVTKWLPNVLPNSWPEALPNRNAKSDDAITQGWGHSLFLTG